MRIAITGDFSSRNLSPDSQSVLLSLFKAHDYIIINVEGMSTDTVLIDTTVIDTRNSPASLKFLDRPNVILNILNNHTFDCGEIGVDKFSKMFNHATIIGVNGYENIHRTTTISKSGVSLKLIPVCYSFKVLRQYLDKIVYENGSINEQKLYLFHGIEEYTRYPIKKKQEVINKLCDANTRAVICSHNHIPQPTLEKEGRVICYSLGNFIFDSSIVQKNFYDYLSLNIQKEKICSSRSLLDVANNVKLSEINRNEEHFRSYETRNALNKNDNIKKLQNHSIFSLQKILSFIKSLLNTETRERALGYFIWRLWKIVRKISF